MTVPTATSSTDDRPLRRSVDTAIPAALLAGAAVGWWWSARMAEDMTPSVMSSDSMGDMVSASPMSMSMSLAAFVVGWAAMMAAMMFPAISPMVRLYARAAARGNVAPVPFFVAGYLVVWTIMGLPAYVAWRELSGPLAEGATWTGRLAGTTFLLAAVYQLTPLKTACLTHCRSPISFFLHHGGTTIDRPSRAARLGAHHGIYCLGCCWALMAILVALGTMNLGWMIALTVLIFIEKVAPHGETWSRTAAVGFVVAGVWLLADPSSITTIT